MPPTSPKNTRITRKVRARESTGRGWPGIMAGMLATGIGVGFALGKVSPDPFNQSLIVAGLLIVAGGNVGLMVLGKRWVGSVVQKMADEDREEPGS